MWIYILIGFWISSVVLLTFAIMTAEVKDEDDDFTTD